MKRKAPIFLFRSTVFYMLVAALSIFTLTQLAWASHHDVTGISMGIGFGCIFAEMGTFLLWDSMGMQESEHGFLYHIMGLHRLRGLNLRKFKKQPTAYIGFETRTLLEMRDKLLGWPETSENGARLRRVEELLALSIEYDNGVRGHVDVTLDDIEARLHGELKAGRRARKELKVLR